VVRIGEKVNSVTRTMGLALTACTPPAKGSPLFELGDDEIEIGVGIHGEPGRRRAKIEPSDALVDQISHQRPAFHLLAGDICYADPSGNGRPVKNNGAKTADKGSTTSTRRSGPSTSG